jgi:hypothetical protein
MASRRKQTKPKAFGLNENELDANGVPIVAVAEPDRAATNNEEATADDGKTAISSESVDDASNSTTESSLVNDRKRKRDDDNSTVENRDENDLSPKSKNPTIDTALLTNQVY